MSYIYSSKDKIMPKLTFIQLSTIRNLICWCLLLLLTPKVWAQYDSYTRSERKLYYKIIEKGIGDRLGKEGEYVTIRWRYYISQDRVLYTSEKTKDGSQRFPIEQDGFKGDFKEIFKLLNVGDSAHVKIPVNFFYPRILGKDRPKGVSGKDFIIMEFRMLKIQSNSEILEEKKRAKEMAQENEPVKILKFLTQQNWKEEPTSSGLYYKILKKGTGKRPTKGSVVGVYYKGYLTSGILFDQVKEGEAQYEFKVGAKNVISAWEEIIATMNSGGKVIILTPSNLAYGAKGVPGTGVGPYEPLVFEIELLEVK